MVDEAIDWLTKKRDKAKPFFLAVWTHEPHLPIETDPRFQEPYADLPEDFRQHHGNVTQLDHAFGKLMKALDEQRLTEKRSSSSPSDNGPEGDGTEEPHPRLHRRPARAEAGDVRGGHPRAGDRPLAGADHAGHDRRRPVIGSDLFPTVLGICGVSRRPTG